MKLPKSWNDVSTANYMRFMALNKIEPKDNADKIDLLIQKAGALCGCDIYTAEKIPISELSKLKELADKPISGKIYKSFKLNGIWFEVITNPKKLDAERYAGVMEAIKKDSIQGLKQTMYYICRPYKLGLFRRKYYDLDEADIPDMLNAFGELPVTITHPIAFFFSKILKECTNYLLQYSELKMKEIAKEVDLAKEELIASMDGLKQ
jgi:hypothetical protein